MLGRVLLAVALSLSAPPPDPAPIAVSIINDSGAEFRGWLINTTKTPPVYRTAALGMTVPSGSWDWELPGITDVGDLAAIRADFGLEVTCYQAYHPSVQAKFYLHFFKVTPDIFGCKFISEKEFLTLSSR